MFAIVPLKVSAGFIVHDVSGDVTLVKGGKTSPVTKGAKVQPGDNIQIGGNGKIEIMNDVNNTIYTSTKSGTFSISRILLDADARASDNHASLSEQMRFGGKSGNGKSKVYVETGMVKRAMAAYDPTASGLCIDAGTLATHLAEIARNQSTSTTNLPFELKHSNDSITGMQFNICNTLDFPIYFNIVNISGTNDCLKAEISSLGQPMGTYVLQPRQTMSRTTPAQSQGNDRHFIVVTHCQYDIDAFLDQLNRILSTPAQSSPDIDIPVYINEMFN